MRIHATPLKPRVRDLVLVGHFEQKLLTVQNISLPSHGSGSVLNVGSDIFQLGEDLGEEAGLGVDPEHGGAEAIDDVDAPVPEAILVRFNEEWLEGVAYFVAHVAAK